jgi:hypothetical protein
MLFRQPDRRQFDYRPLYYEPKKDPEAQRRKRIHFPRYQKPRNPFSRLVIILIILLAAMLYGLKYLAHEL